MLGKAIGPLLIDGGQKDAGPAFRRKLAGADPQFTPELLVQFPERFLLAHFPPAGAYLDSRTVPVSRRSPRPSLGCPASRAPCESEPRSSSPMSEITAMGCDGELRTGVGPGTDAPAMTDPARARHRGKNPRLENAARQARDIALVGLRPNSTGRRSLRRSA